MAKDQNTGTEKKTEKTQTKIVAEEIVKEIDNPLDLWYFCFKCCAARILPADANGKVYKQRAVTRWIRKDSDLFNYNFPYVGEVGFDMTTTPPSPIMSFKEGFRPSSFPISRWRMIREKQISAFPDKFRLEMLSPVVNKDELEGSLVIESKTKGKDSGKGLLRIPDALRLKNFEMPNGTAKFSQSNIQTVIEIKFKGDSLDPFQRLAYQVIAGKDDNLRLVTVEKTCTKYCKKKDDPWNIDLLPAKEPVFQKIGQKKWADTLNHIKPELSSGGASTNYCF